MATDLDLETLLQQYSPEDIDRAAEAEECERDLMVFMERAWPNMDPAPFVRSWHLECVCDHLMAVSDGQIRKLLINIPPRHTKTLASTAWQAWTWAQSRIGPLLGPQVSFMCLSYASQLSLDNALTANRLIKSDWYQRLWGHRVQIAKDKDSSARFDNTKGGSRISVGFDGGTLGRGGAVRLIDDPHKVIEAESELVREGVIKTYDEALATRFTDPKTSVEVVIMQRLHEDDLAGHLLSQGGWVHVNLPLEYDPSRHCVTVLGWQDPRGIDEDGNRLPDEECEGRILDPERFPPEVVENLRETMSAYSYAGQMQQSPAPRGGGLIKSDWWRLWRSKQFPDFGTVVVSLDTAIKEKETNDYNALTVWGAFADERQRPNLMLINAWRGRCSLNALVEKVVHYARRHKADYVLIEDKTRGHDVSQEMRRMFGGNTWSVRLLPAKGDKVSRVISVQGLFSGQMKRDPISLMEVWSGGIVWAPGGEGVEYDWVQPVLDEVSQFPTGKHDDFTDSVAQAVKWMRDNGVAIYPTEHEEEEAERVRFRKAPKALYDV